MADESKDSYKAIIKRAGDFIAQMTEQTVRHQEVRDHVASLVVSGGGEENTPEYVRSLNVLAEADKQLAEGVAMIVAAVGRLHEIEDD